MVVHVTLGTAAARGGSLTLLGQAIKICLQLVGLIILTRLLAPEDFGLTAMVIAFIGVGEILRDFGLSSAAMQAQSLSAAQKSNLFWLNTGFGAAVMILAIAASPLIALFFDEPRLVWITLALSVTFLLNGIGTQFGVELSRNLRFAPLVSVELLAQLFGLVAAFVLALAGAGYWALVAQQIAYALVLCCGRLLVARWRPGFPSRDASVRSFINYGKNMVAAQGLSYAASNTDNLVIGRQFGTVWLGYYNRAYQVLMVPVNQLLNPLTNVVLPVLSKLLGDPARFARAVVGLNAMVGLGATAVFSVICAAGVPAVRVLFGAGWAPAGEALQILAVGGLFQVFAFIGYWVFLATAETRMLLRYNLVTKPLVVACVIAGAFWGPLGVAAGYSVGLALSWPILLLWLRRRREFPALRLALTSAQMVLAGGAVVVVGRFIVGTGLPDFSAVLACAAVAIAVITGWVLVDRGVRAVVLWSARLLQGKQLP